jgi:hypothetical protein
MARGWESKSVEEQMAIASEQATGRSAHEYLTEEQRQAAEQERIQRARQKQSLALQRERILSQRTSSPARRTALEAALKQIEGQIASLG